MGTETDAGAYLRYLHELRAALDSEEGGVVQSTIITAEAVRPFLRVVNSLAGGQMADTVHVSLPVDPAGVGGELGRAEFVWGFGVSIGPVCEVEAAVAAVRKVLHVRARDDGVWS